MPAYIQGRNVNLTFRPPNRGPVRALQGFDIEVLRGRVPVGRRAIGLRQEHVPQRPARLDQARFRRAHAERQAHQRSGHRPRDGVPGIRAAALANRAAQHRARARAQGRGGRDPAQHLGALRRYGRPRRFRGALSARALGRDEAARGTCPRARHRSRRAADGRAVCRPRCPDPRPHAGRAAAHLAGSAQDGAVRHPPDRRGDLSLRPGHGDDQASRAAPRRFSPSSCRGRAITRCG